jgi:hypothetical protein
LITICTAILGLNSILPRKEAERDKGNSEFHWQRTRSDVLIRCLDPMAAEMASFHEVRFIVPGVSCLGIPQAAEITGIILHGLQSTEFFGVPALNTPLGGS